MEQNRMITRPRLRLMTCLDVMPVWQTVHENERALVFGRYWLQFNSQQKLAVTNIESGDDDLRIFKAATETEALRQLVNNNKLKAKELVKAAFQKWGDSGK